MNKTTVFILTLLAASSLLHAAEDDAKPLLHPLFSDHAVLQRDAKVPVWGWADPGIKITVRFAGQEKHAIVGNDGKWTVSLDPMTASAEGRTLGVKSQTSGLQSQITDVLEGDVWLCSGQSNMEMGVGLCKVSDEIAKADHPGIRLLTVPQRISYAPQPTLECEWLQCSPETDAPDWKTIQMPDRLAARGLPGYEGIVWTQRVFQAPDPWVGKRLVLSLGPVSDVDTTWVNGVVVGQTIHFNQPRTYQVPAGIIKAGRNIITMRVLNAGGGGFYGTPEQMKTHPESEDASAISLAGPWRIQDTATRASTDPALIGNPNVGSVLYNGMIAPLVPFAVKGAIWYQGQM